MITSEHIHERLNRRTPGKYTEQEAAAIHALAYALARAIARVNPTTARSDDERA